MKSKAPENNRVTSGNMASDQSFGMNGCFTIPHRNGDSRYYQCIVSDGGGWEHVSVTVRSRNKKDYFEIPNWGDMCYIKDIFWNDDECVMQLHPPKDQHVNHHNFVLHLWRPSDASIPRPPTEYV